MSDVHAKNILLIIDPQNDFHTKDVNNKHATLSVTNSENDATNIVKLINSGKFNEIHVSLDTHTENHIGHSGFYVKGHVPFGFYNDSVNAKKRDDIPDNYLEKYNELHIAKRGGNYQMWPDHCINKTDGHKIYKSIQDELNKSKNVKYHIKGQNELTEMYSIFSATVDPADIFEQIDQKSPPVNKNSDYDRVKGVDSYEEAINSENLETTMNDGLIEHLLGNGNTVYVCGQAKSHCVADSIIDLLNAIKQRGLSGNVVLVDDASSPVLLPGEINGNSKLMEGAQERINEAATAASDNNSRYKTQHTDAILSLSFGNMPGGKKREKSRKLKDKKNKKMTKTKNKKMTKTKNKKMTKTKKGTKTRGRR
uniref:Isochorismatase-like domain-containing protein n=1 Tax=viral metagenome TaxID=1070528 RepID=A0A6C0JA32_9ZZZZ